MINKKYFRGEYTIKPLVMNCYISQCAVQQALYQLNFDLHKTYKLVMGKENLQFAPRVTQGIIDLILELDENIPKYSWYVVDESTKTIIYSAGAVDFDEKL